MFVHNKDDVQGLVSRLKSAQLKCEGYTSELPPWIQEEVLEKFRNLSSDIPLLVSTNILAKGLDFQNAKMLLIMTCRIDCLSIFTA